VALLVGFWHKQRNTYEQSMEYLAELELLVHTIGAVPAKQVLQPMSVPIAATYVGSGKLLELKQLCDLYAVTIVIFDEELSPTQVRNIEKALERRVWDRAGLILQIFSEHARTAQAKAQVELARLEYMLPRLTRMWSHLTRERGGIGLKGAGEQEIETDRRIIRTRIARLKEDLKKIEQQTYTRRKHRSRTVRVALVGYTNVGKSTLMNLMAKTDVRAENKLFATLDTTVRKVVLQGIPFLLSDTVGFIRKLPHGLIESFKSTLDEVKEADILLHVADISNPHYIEHIQVVRSTLDELGAADKPTLMVFNKVDQLNDDIQDLQQTWMHHAHYPAVFISATAREGIERLRELLVQIVIDRYRFKYPGMVHESGYFDYASLEQQEDEGQEEAAEQPAAV